jgi:site-specific DNA-methyltransferase (adenine-specific)
MLEINKTYNMDCFSFLDKVEKETVDLAIIDPPYNMKKADWDTFLSQEAFLDFTYRWIDVLLPKLKLNAGLYIFNTPYNAAFILKYLLDKNMQYKNWITWDKRDGISGSKRKYATGQETILFFAKGNSHTFNYNDIRIPYESAERMSHAKEKGILKNGKRWFPNPNGKLCNEVWHIASERHKRKINGKVMKLPHITPKPLELIERIVKASSNKGDLILDCFVGSGTTAVAAIKNGRNFICADKELAYTILAEAEVKKYEDKRNRPEQ